MITGNRPEKVSNNSRIPVRKILRRDNKGQLSISLPAIAVYNHRSIWKKISNFATEFNNMGIGVSLLSEIWEKKGKGKHQYKLQELLELKGIKCLSTPRLNKIGGGTAITVNNEKYIIKEIKFDNPNKLEVTTALLKPREISQGDFSIIAFAVYCPPKSKKKTKLVDFITTAYHQSKLKYPEAYFLLGGDINDLDVKRFLSISSMFQQLVTLPTRNNKILSVIVTDLHPYYTTPIILPPVQPDIPGVGSPSDHSTPFCTPKTDWNKSDSKSYKLTS